MTFYLDELLAYYEMKHPMAGRKLYYQYHPLSKIEEPKVDTKDPTQELPKAIKNIDKLT